MSAEKTKFWRGFTWKRFVIMTLFWFVLYVSIDFFMSLFDTTSSFDFTYSYFLKNTITSIIMGFLFSLWFEPGIDKDFWKRKKK